MLRDPVIAVSVAPRGETGLRYSSYQATGRRGALEERQTLRIQATVTKTLSPEPNTASVTLYNMARDSYEQIRIPGLSCTIEAGYAQDMGLSLIFVGRLMIPSYAIAPPDTMVKLSVIDGGQEALGRYVAVSASASTPADVVIQRIAGQAGIDLLPLPQGFPYKIYQQGWAHQGPVSDALTYACNFADLEWSIQNGKLQILQRGAGSNIPAIVLSPETGMIGSPEVLQDINSDRSRFRQQQALMNSQLRYQDPVDRAREEERLKRLYAVGGVRVRSLLNTRLVPGGAIQLKSRYALGFFRILSVTHTIDTGPGGICETAVEASL